jgi:uncharacterized protein (TIGR00369 family)
LDEKEVEKTLDTTETTRRMVEAGWTIITDEGFVGMVGPFFQRVTPTGLQFDFPTDPRHHNLRGVLQGGALMTFADRILGISARAAMHATRTATVQLDVHFIDAVQIGEHVEAQPTVLRVTRHIVFMTTALTAGGRLVATANGIWKRLAVQAA